MKNFKEFFTESHECFLDEARKSYGKRGGIKPMDDPAVSAETKKIEGKEKEQTAARRSRRVRTPNPQNPEKYLPATTNKEREQKKKKKDRVSGRGEKAVKDKIKKEKEEKARQAETDKNKAVKRSATATAKATERGEVGRPVSMRDIKNKGIIGAKLDREKRMFKAAPFQRTGEYASGAADVVRKVASSVKGGTTGSEGGDIQGGRSTRIERG